MKINWLTVQFYPDLVLGSLKTQGIIHKNLTEPRLSCLKITNPLGLLTVFVRPSAAKAKAAFHIGGHACIFRLPITAIRVQMAASTKWWRVSSSRLGCGVSWGAVLLSLCTLVVRPDRTLACGQCYSPSSWPTLVQKLWNQATPSPGNEAEAWAG